MSDVEMLLYYLTDDKGDALDSLDLFLGVKVFLLQVALLVFDVFLLNKTKQVSVNGHVNYSVDLDTRLIWYLVFKW